MRQVPPPPPPEPIWLHGKPSPTGTIVVVVCFISYLALAIGAVAWAFSQIGPQS